MKAYKTMITKQYVPDWSVVDGIREYVANALDSPAKLEYSISDECISLTSVGVVLPPSVLTLGTSGNRNRADAVGCHGEGILIGMVPILREGHSIEIHNGNVLWIGRFLYDKDFDKEVLVVDEIVAPCYQDYTVTVKCSSDYIEEMVDRCLYLQKAIGEVLEGQRGRILKDIKNKLYVGGIYVSDIRGYEYSYDFKPQYLPLNRDRKTVDSWDLSREVSRLTLDIMKAEEVVELIGNSSGEVSQLPYVGSWDKVEPVTKMLYDNLKEVHGDDVVITKYWDDAEELKKQGFQKVVVATPTEYELISKYNVYQDAYTEIKERNTTVEEELSPLQMLENWYEDETGDCGRWINFETILDIFKQRGVSFDTKSEKYPDIPF